MSDDIIGKSLGTAFVPRIIDANPPKEIEIPDDVSEDHDFARKNIYAAVESGNDALKEMLTIAKSGETAKDFEAVALLMKTIVEANKTLIDMNDKVVKAKATQDGGEKNVTNNNMFVGSTNELQQMLKDIQSDNDNTDG